MFKNLILAKLIHRLLKRLQEQYQNKFQKSLPIILVTGTVGKSSTTLLINQLLESNNYLIYSGTTVHKNYNSLAGLGMILINYKFNLEGGNALKKVLKQLDFLVRLVWNCYFGSFTLKSETALVYELGFDHQGESKIFKTVFQDIPIDILAVTNLTYEHNQGFNKNFEQEKYELIKNKLPLEIQKDLENDEIDPLLRNTALEQLSLINQTNELILPNNIGVINNTTIHTTQNQTTSQAIEIETNYESNMNLAVVNNNDSDKMVFDSNYLLPITFGKNLSYLNIISEYFKLPNEPIDQQKFIQSLKLPFGRFSKLSGIKGTTLIDSSYNSDPAGLNGMLSSLQSTINHYKITDNLETDDLVLAPNHYLILGEMRELGIDSTEHHKEILIRINQLIKKEPTIAGVCLLGTEWLKCDDDKMIKTSGNVNLIRADGQIYSVYQTAGQIANYLKQEDNLISNSWIWIKGSQNTIFLEIVTKELLKNPLDQARLCRQGLEWDTVREAFL